MADKSTYLANAILDWLLGAGTFAPPATVYVGLFTALPSAGGAGGTEVVGGSYARVAVTNSAANFPAAAAGSKANAAAITFPAATALWGDVVGYGLFDALSGGHLLKYAPLVSTRTVQAGDQPSFGVGDLIFSES